MSAADLIAAALTIGRWLLPLLLVIWFLSDYDPAGLSPVPRTAFRWP
jgi:hypothetical protein